jgi:Protein of unknown function (DUF1353)
MAYRDYFVHLLSAVAIALSANSVQAADLNISSCTSCFHGLPLQLKAWPNPKSTTKKMLLRDLYFTDSRDVTWKTDKGYVTDGASIPTIFLRLLGGSRFEPDFLPASIVHDHYCDKHVRTWWDAAKMFYQGMVANSTPGAKARIMFYAVYVFGPHWGELEAGTYCGENCINVMPPNVQIQDDGTIVTLGGPAALPPGKQFYYKPADYSMRHRPEIEDIKARIAAADAAGKPLSINELKAIGSQRHPNDAFIQQAAIEK